MSKSISVVTNYYMFSSKHNCVDYYRVPRWRYVYTLHKITSLCHNICPCCYLRLILIRDDIRNENM